MTKIIHSVSGQVIDVPDSHAQMLKGQGWSDYQGAKHEKDADADAEGQGQEKEVLIVPEKKKPGRPKKK